MFDWNKEWHPGEEPPVRKGSWKDTVNNHPWETYLLFVLVIGILVWVGVR